MTYRDALISIKSCLQQGIKNTKNEERSFCYKSILAHINTLEAEIKRSRQVAKMNQERHNKSVI